MYTCVVDSSIMRFIRNTAAVMAVVREGYNESG